MLDFRASVGYIMKYRAPTTLLEKAGPVTIFHNPPRSFQSICTRGNGGIR